VIEVSKILAAAVLELFPETLLLPSNQPNNPHGFGADFIFPFQLSSDLLVLIEEKMVQIAKEKRGVKILEMVPASASAFLEHKEQPLLAEAVKNSEDSLVTLLQMGEFVDHCDPAFSWERCQQFKIFRLLETTQKETYQGEPVTRLSGAAFETKDALKEFLKKRETFPQKDHLIVGQDLDLFTLFEEGVLWHPRGEAMRSQFLHFWKGELAKQNFEILSTTDLGKDLTANHCKYFLAKGARRLAEVSSREFDEETGWKRGLLTPKNALIDHAHIFCEARDLLKESISCLQFIVKILKILQFKFRLVLCSSCKDEQREKEGTLLLERALHVIGDVYTVEKRKGPAVEIFIQDGMGQEWKAAFVKIDCRLAKEEIILFSLLNPLERLIALLLENREGHLPLWLAPEQARVFGVKENEYAQGILDLLQRAGLRATLDIRGEKLATRLHEALQRKIPWLVVVGQQERERRLVTVRACLSGSTEEMPIESFIEQLHKEQQL